MSKYLKMNNSKDHISTQFVHKQSMGNVHKSKAIDLKGDPYIGVCQSSIGNTWAPVHMNRLL